MNESTGSTTTERKLVLRVFGGMDQSVATQFSDDSFYELYNLRPNRGSLEQPQLIGGLLLNISSGSS